MTFSTKLKCCDVLNTCKSVMSTSSKLSGVPYVPSRVMSDIYSGQDEILLQNGLADAEEECGFDAKLESLRPVGEEIAPGIHQWFKSHRSKLFKDFIVLYARENLGIEGRIYTNGPELKHKLQKKKMAEECPQRSHSRYCPVIHMGRGVLLGGREGYTRPREVPSCPWL